MAAASSTMNNVKNKFKFFNQHRWRLPDIHSHPKFRTVAINVTRVGFLGKAFLYGSMGCIAMIAASGADAAIDEAQGPQTVLENFGSRGGEASLFFFAIGLICYSIFAFLFCFFDFDQLGHHGAMPVLSRFGRVFSAGFYGFLAVYAIELILKVRRGSSFTLTLAEVLFSTTPGRVVLCFLGFVFFVVAIVYFSYIIKPAKFRRELASENMPPTLFYTAVWIARGGSIGRVLFFGSFGGVMFDSVINNRGVQQGSQSILGFEGVLNRLALTSHVLLFITGAFLMLYALWCLILSAFRRLPAHYNEKESLNCVGVRYKVWKEARQQKALLKRQVAMAKLAAANNYGTADGEGAAVVTTPLMARPSFKDEHTVSIAKSMEVCEEESDECCDDDNKRHSIAGASTSYLPSVNEIAINIAKSGEMVKSDDSMYRQARPITHGSRSSLQFGSDSLMSPSVAAVTIEPVFDDIALNTPIPLRNVADSSLSTSRGDIKSSNRIYDAPPPKQ